MRRNTIAAAAIFTLVTAATLTGCSSDEGSAAVAADCKPIVDNVTTEKAGELSIAVAEFPPYVSLAGGSLSGVDGEILTRVAEDLCLVPKAQTQSFTAVIESVKNGSADLSAGNWYINEERKDKFEVSDPAYEDQMVVISKEGLTSLEELEGHSVGTTQGYLWVGDFQKVLGDSNVQLYASEDAAFQDIRAGRVEAGIFTAGAAKQLLDANNEKNLKIEPFKSDKRIDASVNVPVNAVLITKGKTALLEAVNLTLAEMRDDGSLEAALEKAGLDPAAATISAAG